MIVTIDFETHYSSEYSLSKMSEVAYILDPRFEVICCAIKLGDGPTEVLIGFDAVRAAFERIDWSQAAVLSHNMRFDGAILAWHFHIKPKLYLCTLSMARALTHVAAGGSSLAKVAKYLGLPDKGTAVVRALGKVLAAFAPDELAEYAAYCAHDAELCFAIFQRFLKVFPVSELAVVDLTQRMFIEPEVKLNPTKLAEHLGAVRSRKAAVMQRVGYVDPAVFSSNAKFALLLQSYGVDVPTKLSPATGRETWALARGDRAFKELCEDAEQPEEVQAILAARIGSKSTIEETRTETMLNLSLRSWGNDSGWCPVPLKYYGAHTGRFSGDGGFNFQNLRRDSPIRDAMEAPEGYRIIHRDSSQIEARMVAWLAGCRTLLDAFAKGRDIYSEFASKVYGRPVTKKDVGDRFVGKTSILGLGYGMGASRFQHTLFIGNGGVSKTVELEEAARIVYLYRDEYYDVPALWSRAGLMLLRMIGMGGDDPSDTYTNFEPIPAITYSSEAIWLPNGMAIQYPRLRRERVTQPDGSVGNEIYYDGGRSRGQVKLFGGKVAENISQALARIVITDAALRIQTETGFRPFLSTHDSLDYVAPAGDAEALDALLDREFAVRPAWAPDLPLASEGGWGITLKDAERKINA